MPEEHSCIYVETTEDLQAAVNLLEQESQLAIDLECENNLHHYGMYISLVQVSTYKQQYVFDIIQLKTLGGLQDILEDSNVKKVFHDISFDLRILAHEFDCHPKNIFDTKLAATFLKKPDVGLGDLLHQYFGVVKKKKFQMADWTKRPLKPGMLAYAADDTTMLLQLHDRLIEELKAHRYYDWYVQECADIQKQEWIQKLPSYQDIKGFKSLSPVQQTIVQYLYEKREELAQKTDKPPHFIMTNKKILALAKDHPKSIAQWQSMVAVHPVVKRQARTYLELIKKAQTYPLRYPLEKPKRYSLQQRNEFALLNRAREELAAKTGLVAHLILNKEQMQRIVLEKNVDCLRPWQKELLKESGFLK